MRKLLFIACLVLTITGFAQQKKASHIKPLANSYMRLQGGGYQQPLSTNALLDSTNIWVWDTIANVYKFGGRSINYTYNANNKLTGYLNQYGNYTTWNSQQQYTYTYDANNNFTSSLEQDSNSFFGAWSNVEQSFYTYDANNNLTNTFYQYWNNNAWSNSGQNYNTYDANNNLISSLSEGWYGTAWTPNSKTTYTYDVNNNLTNSLAQEWLSGAWVDSVKTVYTYTNNNNTYNITQRWNGSSWINNTQDFITYDANHNCTNHINQSWNGSSWDSNYEYYYAYDANNNNTYFLNQYWANNTWNNCFKTASTYNSNNDILTQVLIDYQSNTATPIPDSTIYYYRTTTGINKLSTNNEQTTIYPNPSNGNFVVETNTETKQTLQVYDINGKVALTQTITGKATVDASSLSQGVYNLSIISNEGVVNKRVVIVR